VLGGASGAAVPGGSAGGGASETRIEVLVRIVCEAVPGFAASRRRGPRATAIPIAASAAAAPKLGKMPNQSNASAAASRPGAPSAFRTSPPAG
jgi:hypothetical protein